MDARLKSLVAAVEAGAAYWSINLLVGPWIVQGTPVSSQVFVAKAHQGLGRIALEKHSPEVRRKVEVGEADHLWQEAMQETVGMIGPLTGSTSSPEDAVSLINVQMTGGTSGVIRASSVRVPIAAVGAWWIADFNHVRARIPVGGGFTVEL